METGMQTTCEETVTLLGTQMRFFTSKAPWRDADGNVIGVIGIARDVTERWCAQELAQQRQAQLAHVLRLKTMGEMAASLAHELNQPLAAVTNYARGCMRRVLDRTTTVEDLVPILEEISSQAIRAGNIIRRLRDLVRQQPTRQERFEVNDLIRETARLADLDMHRAGIALHLRLGDSLFVEGDSIQIEQVVLNLIKNAAEATTDGGSIIVESAAAEDNTVEIAVSDNGRGLAPELLETIFDPFFTTKESGLGMGLAISRSIAEAHRGRLSAENRPSGGATFRLVLPRVTESPRPEATKNGAPPWPLPTR